MKRHPSLEPFSRDHNDGLILARRLMSSGARALPQFKEAWEVELRDHFSEEARILGPLCSVADRERLIREHLEIESLGFAAPSDEGARSLGRLLNDHIRWEERVLFVRIEATATEAQLAAIDLEAGAMELRRGQADPRRAELVARRDAPAKDR